MYFFEWSASEQLNIKFVSQRSEIIILFYTVGYICISNDTFFHWNHGLKLNKILNYFFEIKNSQNGQKMDKKVGQNCTFWAEKRFKWSKLAFFEREKLGKHLQNGQKI